MCGHLVEETDSNGYTTVRDVNALGQLIRLSHPDGSQEHFTYHLAGGMLASHTDVHGAKTAYTYDLLDNLIKTEIEDSVSEASYSPFYLLSEKDSLGIKTTLIHDLIGRKIGEKKGERECSFFYNKRGDLAKTVEGDVITHFIYDLKGQLLTKKIPGFFEENYSYDEAGNRITTTTCAGTHTTDYNGRNEPTRIIDPLGNATEFFYSSEQGLTKTIREPNGVSKVIQYDFREHPIKIQTIDVKGNIIQCEERTYDLAGNQIRSTHPLEGIWCEWCYGPRNRLEGVIECGLKEWRYLYDERGRLARVVKPDGNEIRRAYDSQGRLSHLYGESIDYTYVYDAKSRITTINDGRKQTQLTYDIYDNILSEKLSSGLMIQREYDPFGRKKRLIFPDGSTLAYSYKGPYLHSITRKSLTLTYKERNLAGKVTQISLPNELGIEIEWDPLLRWKRFEAPHFKASYDYDAVGNLCQTNEKVYRHDLLHELISEKGHLYTYDTLYNRTSKDGVKYELNALSQVISDGEYAYSYDKNGNLLSDGVATYEYDLLDRLIAVTKEGKKTLYMYDALNRRIAKDAILYIWDGDEEIGTVVQGKISQMRHVGEKRPVFFEYNDQIYIPVLDQIGSVIGLLSQEGELCESYEYTAFGECKAPSSNWGFAGKRHDPESGFLYFGRRYYSPLLGRWITADPQGFQDGPNPYAYVCNNPLLYEDPFGLFAHSVAETHNPLDFLGFMWYAAFRAVEWIGQNMLPIPGVCDAVEAVGRVGRGGDFYKPRADPRVIQIPGIEVPHLDKTYHNGILTSRERGSDQGEAISEMYGGVAVDLLYNPSHGIVCDLIMCLIAKCGIKTAYERMCARYYAAKLERDRHREFHATAHSQGATRLYNVGNILSAEQCQHITVETFGPATIIPEDRFKKVDNYLSWIDGVPWTSTCSYLKNIAGMDSNVTFLTPYSKNPLTEHYLLSDTYREQLRRNGKDFSQKYFN